MAILLFVKKKKKTFSELQLLLNVDLSSKIESFRVNFRLERGKKRFIFFGI